MHRKQPIILDKAYKWIKNKSIAPILLSAIIITSAGTFSTTARATDEESTLKESMQKACFAYYDGHNIGAVQGSQQVEAILEDIRKEFEAKYNMETILDCDIEYEDIYIGEQFLTSIGDIERVLRANVQPRVKATIIEIDGQETAIIRDEETAQALFDSIFKPYRDKAQEAGTELEEIGFEEDVKLKELYVEYEKLDDPEKVLQSFIESKEEKQVYTVVEGDNVWTIAERHNMTVWELLEINAPMEESDILQIGQELILNVPELPLNVLTLEEVKYNKSIPFETEKKQTDSLYTGQTKVSQEGEKGESEIVDRVYKRNGIEKERERVSEKVIKKPVKKIVLVGTKKRPNSGSSSRGGNRSSSVSGSGSMSWPLSGKISSGFGRRNGRLHAGIDIPKPKGTPVYAADSGTVIYSGHNGGGYGNLVKISHGGGIVTYYAHLSSRAVSQGASVKKGQLIGYVGNTGNSRGNHLHFEVRVNGTPRNPLNYLK